MEDMYWIWLSRIEGIGSITIKKLLDMYNTPKNIWKLTKKELINIKGIGKKAVSNILNEKYRKDLDKYLKYMEKYDIKIITIKDKQYPLKLKNIYDPPQILFAKGNTNILNDKSIAIVGCRECTTYGKVVAEDISYNLAKNNIRVISGMAKGIDTHSHLGCIKAKGKTIAVLGSRTR